LKTEKKIELKLNINGQTISIHCQLLLFSKIVDEYYLM